MAIAAAVAVVVATQLLFLFAICSFLVEWKWKLRKLYRNQCYRSSHRRRGKLDGNGRPAVAAKTQNKKKNDQTNNNTQLFDGCTCSGWLCCQRNCNCNCNSKRSVASSRRWPGLRCTTFHMSGETSSTSATSFCICCGSWFSHHLQPKRVERHRLAN